MIVGNHPLKFYYICTALSLLLFQQEDQLLHKFLMKQVYFILFILIGKKIPNY